MSDYDMLRAIVSQLEELRAELTTKIQSREGDLRIVTDLHERVSEAQKALSGQG